MVEIRVEGKVLRVPRNLVKAYHSADRRRGLNPGSLDGPA
ncbi:LSU ribosomal protein L32p [Cutibacterium acnes JCM 18916]|nr:LSU ribosomal protein L32p [Cutibacterium acnes JCM 18916]